MSTRGSIYYSHEDNVHVYLEYTNGTVVFDLPGFFYSIPAKKFLFYVKIAKALFEKVQSEEGLETVENYVRTEEES